MQYVTGLRDHLLPSCPVHPPTSDTFMHDGTPSQKNKVGKSFLKENNINMLYWPGNFPDLSSIENA